MLSLFLLQSEIKSIINSSNNVTPFAEHCYFGFLSFQMHQVEYSVYSFESIHKKRYDNTCTCI